MSSVDSRIVTMKFDNAAFERGVGTTMGTIGKLKGSLDFSKTSGNSQRALGDLQKATGKFDASPVSTSIDGVSGRLLAMSAIGVTALATIASKAIEVGSSITSNLTSSIKDGFSDYELKIGATQTIMAGTGEDIGTVSKYLKELDEYADDTIYNLRDMTSNISKFTNAGVKLPLAVKSMKGVANVAALSGANANEAARSMYNFGQAIGSGSVKLMDWKSIELANMATKEFKTQLLDSAVAAGTLQKTGKGMYKTLKGTPISATKGFNMSLQEGWLTSKALTNTLADYSDKTTEIGKRAYAAAQDVKTFSMMTETLKASAGTGWTDSFEIVLGNLPEATEMFTNLTTVISGFISASSDSRNKVLKDWKKLGGRTALIKTVANVFHALMAILKPIHDAFREIFPKKTGKDLANLTKTIRDFTAKLIVTKGTGDKIKRIFKGVFAVFSIGWTIVKNIAKAFFNLIGLFAGGGAGGGVLEFLATIGDLLVKFQEWLVVGGKINKVFETGIAFRAALLKPIIAFVGKLIEAFASLISGGPDVFVEKLGEAFAFIGPILSAVGDSVQTLLDGLYAGLGKMGNFGSLIRTMIKDIVASIGGMLGGMNIDLGSIFNMGDAGTTAKAQLASIGTSLKGTTSVAETLKTAWDDMVNGFRIIGQFLAPVWQVIENIFGGFKDKVIGYVSNLGFNEGLAIVNTGFFIFFYMMLRKFLKNLSGLTKSLKGTLDAIKSPFKQLTSNLKTMQNSVRATIILKIAAAILMLALAVLILAKIPAKDISKALGAITFMLIQFVVALKRLEKIGGKDSKISGAMQVTLLAAAMLAMAAAMVVMSAAIAVLGNLKPKTLQKGLLASAAIVAGMVGAAAALNKLGGAGQLILAAAALTIMAAGLVAMAGAIKLFSAIKKETLIDGGLKVVAILAGLGIAMRAFPPDMIIAATGLLIVAGALVILAGALKLIGSMSWSELAKAMVTVYIVLGTLASVMMAMTGTAYGAVAMFIAASALMVLGTALAAIGQLDWITIAKGLAAMAGVFLILGLAALILAPICPIILILAISLGILGLAVLGLGTGLLLLSMGLAALAVTGAAGFAVLMAGITAFIEMFPLIMQQIGLGIIAFAKVIQDSGPPLMRALTTVLMALLKAVINITPRLGRTIVVLLTEFLRIIGVMTPKIVRAGWKLLMDLLKGVRDNIAKVVDVVADIIVKFLNALAKAIPRIIQAGVNLFLAFVNGITRAINNKDNQDRLGTAGTNLATAIVNGLIRGLSGAGGLVVDAARNLAGNALDSMFSVFHSNSPSKETERLGLYAGQGLAIGLTSYSGAVADSAAGVAGAALDVISYTMSKIPEAISSEFDVSPTITPVLDLTQMSNEASKIGTMLDTQPLSADVSLGQASGISAEQQAAQSAAAEAALLEESKPPIEFNQYNTSPKALSPIEIYRQTKNQISLAKEALKPNAVH